MKSLTKLEIQSLLFQAGIIKSLSDVIDSCLIKDFTGERGHYRYYDPKKSPVTAENTIKIYSDDKKWLKTEIWNNRFDVNLGSVQFIIIETTIIDYKDEPFEEYTFYKIFFSEGASIDSKRIKIGEITELLKSAESHLPVSIQLARVEISTLLSEIKQEVVASM